MKTKFEIVNSSERSSKKLKFNTLNVLLSTQNQIIYFNYLVFIVSDRIKVHVQ